MKMTTVVRGDPVRDTLAILDRIEQRHTRAAHTVADMLKDAWREEIVDAGLGARLSNTVRGAAYPGRGQTSLNPAAMVYVKRSAVDVVSAHDEGALIRSPNGLFLAVPTPAAGRGRRGRKITPREYEQRTGIKLRYVYRKGRPALLVADDARLRKSGLAVRKGGRRRQRDGILTGAQTVVVFVLLPQVKLRKRTDLLGVARKIAARLPQLVFDGVDY